MSKGVFFTAGLCFALMFLFAHSSFAFYIWVDEKGVTHVTDYPKPTKQQPKELEEEKQESAPSSDQDEKSSVAAPSTLQPQAEQKTVPAAPPPASIPAQKPLPVAPSMPAQPASKGTTSILPATQQQPMVVPQTSQGVPRPSVPVALSPRDKRAAELRELMTSPYMMTVLLVGVAFYLYYCLCTYLIAKKLDVPAAWLAWVPILQIWTFLRSAGKPLWWVLLLFVPILNLFFMIYLWMCIVENLGRNKWLALLMLVPVAPLILLGVLAFSSKET